MTINIVRPTDGWVLQHIAEAWRAHLPFAKCDTRPDMDADVNIWCNYAVFESAGRMTKTNCDIGFFTHREDGELGRLFDLVALHMDHCIAMCTKTARYLPPQNTTVIHTAPSGIYRRRPIVLGVVGRAYPRKRLHLMQKVQTIDGVEVRHTGGRVHARDMPEWYAAVDYVLVLSDNEGGPMCVPEALVNGKAVIAPNVGWCWDYPVIRYNDEADLMRVVRGLIPPTVEEETSQIMQIIDGMALC